MPAYMFVDIDISDLPTYVNEYATKSPALVKKHGGEYLARGGNFEVMEGDYTPKRIALFKFPDMQSIRNYLNDPEYQPVKAIRHRVAKTNAVAFEGI